MKLRKAVALIELIFAMVIIAITLLSVPNLISRTSEASKSAITQEAISNAAAYGTMILSSFWDENSTDPQAGNPILETNSTTPGLSEANVTVGAQVVKLGYRVGSAKTTSRRYSINNSITRYRATPKASFGLDANDNNLKDDIDDYDNNTTTLVIAGANALARNGDFKDTTINITTTVDYISDAPTNITLNNAFNKQIVTFNNPFIPNNAQTSNIKMVTITLTSQNDPNKRVVLREFSCNIGSAKITKKSF